MISEDILKIREAMSLVMKRPSSREKSLALTKLEEAELWLGKLDRKILSRDPDAPVTGTCRFCDKLATIRRQCGEIHGKPVYDNVCAECYANPPTSLAKTVKGIID
jgi:hypothetical protein